MGSCCSNGESVESFALIAAVEAPMEGFNVPKKQNPPGNASIQGPNPLTFQPVEFSDSSSDIEESLLEKIKDDDKKDRKK